MACPCCQSLMRTDEQQVQSRLSPSAPRTPSRMSKNGTGPHSIPYLGSAVPGSKCPRSSVIVQSAFSLLELNSIVDRTPGPYAGFTSPARADCYWRSCNGYSGGHSSEKRDFSDRLTGPRRHAQVVCYQCGQTGHVRRHWLVRVAQNGPFGKLLRPATLNTGNVSQLTVINATSVERCVVCADEEQQAGESVIVPSVCRIAQV